MWPDVFWWCWKRFHKDPCLFSATCVQVAAAEAEFKAQWSGWIYCGPRKVPPARSFPWARAYAACVRGKKAREAMSLHHI